MDHLRILKQAWEITWRYRALWVFGIILALTTSRGGGNFGGQYNINDEDLSRWSGQLSLPSITSEIVSLLIGIGVALVCLALVLALVSAVARYVTETALIRMVDDHQETGERRSVRQGFRMGWSRAAWRLFLIDLLVGLPVALAFILLFVLALVPLLLWTTDSTGAKAIGTVATIGLVFLFVLVAILVGVLLTLLSKFFRRACVLEKLGVIESIRRGFGVVREHLRDVAIMWLIMAGVSLGLGVAMLVVVLLLVALGVVLGGLPALLVGGLAGQILEGAAPWMLAAAVGIPIFLLVVGLPTLFVGGLVEVFKSSVWTLVYRELRALEGVSSEPHIA
jgi:hypothetical protein